MKAKLVLLLFGFVFFLFPRVALAQESYQIDKFISDIDVLNSGEIHVTEKINVTFNEQKHGIYRDIPYVYQDKSGKKTYTKIHSESVFQDNSPARVSKSSNEGYLRLKIGDADKTLTGAHQYRISYFVAGALAPYSDFDELYWNVTGNLWDAPISSVEAVIVTPVFAIQNTACYEGAEFSTEKCNIQIENRDDVKFASTRPFNTGEGMTIAASFKKGLFPIITIERPKTFFEKLFSISSIFTFLIAAFCGVILVLRIWFKNGRDFWHSGISGMLKTSDSEEVKPIGAHEPIVVEFTPPENLPPALIGVLIDEKADTLDVTATIIDLASRGFLTIDEISKEWMFGSSDYILKSTNKDQAKLLPYERELLTRLFTEKVVILSMLKTKFYDDLAQVKLRLYKEVVDRGYFAESPQASRTKYSAAGFVLIAVSLGGLFFFSPTEIIILVDIFAALLVTGMVLLIFSRFMPRRTAQGRELARRIKGYRMFIDRAESYKQKFFENKNILTDVLPYAIVFGLTAKFAKALADMGIKPANPTWYNGVNAFNVMSFSSNMNEFSSSLSQAIASTPSSSGSGGGGFSGGGFGGGGGGSW